MKNKTHQNKYLNSASFDQLFFLLLLIGLVPLSLLVSQIFALNIIDLSSMVPWEMIDDDLSNNRMDALRTGVKFENAGKLGLLGLYGFLLLACSVWFWQRKEKFRVFLLVQGFLLIWIIFNLLSIQEAAMGEVNQLSILLIFILAGLYCLFAPFSIYYFVKHGHIRSKAFFATLVFVTAIFGIMNALFFAASGILLRLIFLVIKQNVEIVQALSFKRFAFIFLKSALFWLPLLLFVIPGEKMSDNIYKSSINGIYTHIFGIEQEEGSERGFKKAEFEADLENYLAEQFAPIKGEALQEKFDRIEEQVTAQANGLGELSAEQSNAVPKLIADTYAQETDKAIQGMKPYFKKEDCGWHIILPTSCCIMNGVKSFLFSKIVDLNDEMEAAVEKNVRKALKDANAEIQNGSKTSEEVILATLEENRRTVENEVLGIENSIRNSIMNVYNAIILTNLIMDLLLVILIVKSFLVVFARVAFSGQDEIYVTLLDPNQKMQNGQIKKCGSHYTILDTEEKNYYTSRSYEPSGRPPKFAIPQKGAAALSRMRTGNYALNHIVMRNRDGAVYYHALGGTEFVEWTLEEGEEVIFNLKNFVAMSEDIQLSLQYSFRLTSLLLGRLRFTVAKGPGKLILLTKGRPTTSEEDKGNASVPMNRIIAFQKNTRFHVHSELNIIDVFLSGIYLEKKPGDLLIIDADEKGSAKSGISKFIKGFLLPV